ncbi:tRNA (N(6)-L-threonylcarbamoyladenosine(37)-C(2))-methylthiotransferase [Candidatus Woesearchaeota archaeon]|nr:tRNA (N(6)-L-threonylcarbamoyladenosine(37)-C(2))-methylthiotransferase [Candidatus Woesearchaeota archaeon]
MNIFIRTFGCTLNQSDSEVMKGLLVKAGHELVDNVENADLVVFNTCTVKDNPEKRFFSELERVKKLKKKVVVAGCIPQADQHNELLKNISLIGVKDVCSVAEVVERTSKGDVVRLLRGKDKKRLSLPKIRKNPVVEIIPLCSGCLGECSYCKTRFARGKLLSYDAKTIKKQFENAVKDGVKQIWLTSQDSGAYGKDIGSSLPVLLKELLSVKGAHLIRLGMLNPNHALEFLDELINIYKHPNMFKFAHLPVQSGSNNILKLMNRKYKAEDFVKIVNKLRKEIPNITIATDVICGFPGETQKDFEKTYKLLEKLRIPVVNLTKFCARPGTPAKKMKQLDTRIIKQRSKKINELQEKNINNKEWTDWQGKIIIDEIGKNNSFVGRNNYYKPVVIKNVHLKISDIVEVRVNRVVKDYLEAVLI